MPMSPDRIRSVAVVGHSHDGKTTLCEALLHTAGATQRLGSTDQGTSILDHEPEEQRRSISIASAVAHGDWDGTRINLIDAPGFQDFAGEVVQALAGADAAMLVLSGTGTVPVGAELAWELVTAAGLPSLVVVNKMDKENAAYEATVDAVRSARPRVHRRRRPDRRGGWFPRVRGPCRRSRIRVRQSRARRRDRFPRGDARRGRASAFSAGRCRC